MLKSFVVPEGKPAGTQPEADPGEGNSPCCCTAALLRVRLLPVSDETAGPGVFPEFVFKICRASEWRTLQAEGEWRGSPHDLRDGFIHLSTEAQVAGTLAKHFAGEADLVLLKISSAALGARLRWEPSRGGELFPHLYAPLAASMAAEVPFEDVLRGAAIRDATSSGPGWRGG